MNEWLSTSLPIHVVPDRSKSIIAISEPNVGMKTQPLSGGDVAMRVVVRLAPASRSQPEVR